MKPPVALSSQEIFSRVVAILVREFDVSADEISMQTNLEADLDLDSLDAVALASWVEEDLGLALSDDEIEQMRSVEQIVVVISARLSASEKAG
ncbi:MAG: phosphopantetheine-binding protein [Myxococcota bacterium]